MPLGLIVNVSFYEDVGVDALWLFFIDDSMKISVYHRF